MLWIPTLVVNFIRTEKSKSANVNGQERSIRFRWKCAMIREAKMRCDRIPMLFINPLTFSCCTCQSMHRQHVMDEFLSCFETGESSYLNGIRTPFLNSAHYGLKLSSPATAYSGLVLLFGFGPLLLTRLASGLLIWCAGIQLSSYALELLVTAGPSAPSTATCSAGSTVFDPPDDFLARSPPFPP